MKRILFTCVLLCLTGIFKRTLAQAPVITGDAKDTIVCQGNDIAFVINASNNPTQYEWQLSGLYTTNFRDILSNNTIFSGLNTNTLVVHTASVSLGYIVRCIASNPDGSSAPSPTYKIRIAQPHPGFPINNTGFFPGTVCQGSTNNYFQSGMNYDIDSVLWSYSGTGASIHRNYANIHSVNDSSIAIDFSSNATPGILSAIDSNACGIYTSVAAPITINPPPAAVGGAVGYGPICTTLYYYPVPGLTEAQSACAPISALTPTGTNPANGYIKSCVEMDSTVQSFSGVPYVQRHYSIEPQTIDGSTSTATITLYFTQADFDDYNLARGSNPALPTGPTDATGISNLHITQFHGTGTNPGTYVGGSGDIDPDDNNIVWNTSASRWEVTFNITGFSGFFVSGGSLVPLPLTLVSFTGQSVTGGNLLKWTTSSEENTHSFEIERNSSGNDYQSLAALPAAGNSHQELNYSYTDPSSGITASRNAYRLKMTDIDGKFTYSKTVVIQSPLTTLTIRAVPNPFYQPLSLTVSSPEPASAVVTVTDISGKLLWQQPISLNKGDNSLDPGKVAALPKGMYILSITTDRQKQTVKLIRK